MNTKSTIISRQNIGLLFFVIFCGAFSSLASAQATFSAWTPIYQGVSYATGSQNGSELLYAVRIDLTAPGISFVTTPSSPSAVSQGYETYSQTTGGFLTSVGASVAINANFFSNVQSTSFPENLSGLAVSQGSVVAPADPNFQSLFITADNVASIGSSSAMSIYNAVSGVQVLQNGVPMVPTNPTAGDPTGLDPRTGVGVSMDGRYLYLFTADGREAQSVGITDLNEGQILLQLGAYNGLNLDGGGSTSLVRSNGSGGATVLNVPSGGTQRLDGNNFAVFARPLVTEPIGKYQIECVASGLSVNVSGASTSKGAAIIQYSYSGTPNELWTFVPTSNGYYQIQNVTSSLDLVVQGASTANGAKIIQWSFGSSGDDQWQPVQNSDGSYTFHNLHSGLVLDDPGYSTASATQFDQWGANGGSNQKFNLISQ